MKFEYAIWFNIDVQFERNGKNNTSKLANSTTITNVVENCTKFSDKSINLSKNGKQVQIENFEYKTHFMKIKNFISTFRKIAYILINASYRGIYWIFNRKKYQNFERSLMKNRMFCKKQSEQNMVQTIGSGSLVLANCPKKIDKNIYSEKFYNKAQIKIQNSRKNMKILIQNQIGIIKKSLQNQLRSLIKFDSNRKKYQI